MLGENCSPERIGSGLVLAGIMNEAAGGTWGLQSSKTEALIADLSLHLSFDTGAGIRVGRCRNGGSAAVQSPLREPVLSLEPGMDQNSFACFACCQEYLPFYFLPSRFIHLHFFYILFKYTVACVTSRLSRFACDVIHVTFAVDLA